MAGNTWAAGCRGKVRYQSRRRALAAIRVLARQPHAREPALLEPYHCREGAHWHVGHRRRSVPAPLLRVKARAGDVVEITWRQDDGGEVVERHTKPGDVESSE